MEARPPTQVVAPQVEVPFPTDPLTYELTLRPRILFLTNIPSPYQVDFFTALAARSELQIRVLFCAGSEQDRGFTVPETFAFDGRILPGLRWPGTPVDWHRVPGLTRLLDEPPVPDVAVLSGSYFMPAFLTARRWAIRRRIPWWYWGENPCKKPGGGWRTRLREAYLRRLLGSSAGVFGVGRVACDQYRRLMPPGRPVHNLPYAPNLDPLLNPSSSTRQAAAALRAAWPVQRPIVVLFSGSLTPRKAPEVLLAAFAQIAAPLPDLCLQFAGDGPLRRSLKREVARLGLVDRVRFLGFVEGPALHAAYLSSDLFVLPTRTHEGWGVVVQEALAAGLPVLLSSLVGSGADVTALDNAAVEFPPDNVAALAEHLTTLSADQQRRDSFGHQARTTARALDCHASAEKTAGYLGLKEPLRAIVFDMGDVLYDASQWRRWLVRELNQLGIVISFSEFVFRWGGELVPVYQGRTAYMDAFDRLLASLLPDDSVRAEFKTRSLEAKARFEGQTRRPFKGVPEMLAELRSAGLKLAVLSDTEASTVRIRQSLDHLGLGGLFDAIVTSRDIGHAKPDAGAYQAVLQQLGFSAQQSLFVGHDQDELDGAREFGMCTVSVETTGPTQGHAKINGIGHLAAYILGDSPTCSDCCTEGIGLDGS